MGKPSRLGSRRYSRLGNLRHNRGVGDRCALVGHALTADHDLNLTHTLVLFRLSGHGARPVGHAGTDQQNKSKIMSMIKSKKEATTPGPLRAGRWVSRPQDSGAGSNGGGVKREFTVYLPGFREGTRPGGCGLSASNCVWILRAGLLLSPPRAGEGGVRAVVPPTPNIKPA